MALAPALVDRFASDWRALTRDRGSERTLVAVSGGADSIALLLLAHQLLGDRCCAATVDHGLREGSADEAAGVAGLCARLGVAHATLQGPLPARAGGTANLSARARELRYALLRRHALSVDAQWLATAHHADDQLETMIMRLNRGSGVGGLAAIRSVERPEEGPLRTAVVRPLLGWRHAELAAIVAAETIAPVHDPSNSDDRFDRARLRKRLQGVDWIDPVMAARSASHLAEAEAAIAWAAAREARERCRFTDGRAVLTVMPVPTEIDRRLVELCLRHVDPGIVLRGRDLTELIAKLETFESATLGKVRCGCTIDGLSAAAWTFAAAPPRRTI